MMEVYRLLAHPSERITQKMVQTTGIETTCRWGPIEVRLQVKTEQQAVQWIDGPDKTSSNGVDDESHDVKPGEGESVRNKGALQLDVQELELEQQPASQARKKKIQEAPRDPEEGIQEAPPDPGEETQEVPPDLAVETRKAPSDCEERPQKALPNPAE